MTQSPPFQAKPGSSQQCSSPPTCLATIPTIIRMKRLRIPSGVLGREPQSRVPHSQGCSAIRMQPGHSLLEVRRE